MPNLWIYGDSLSSGTHGKNAYLDTVRASLGVEVLRNFAVGSSGLTETTPNSMVSILRQQAFHTFQEEPDIILIWHGSNDWYWGSPLGERGDRDEHTYRGAIRWVVALLRKHYPNALILWPDSIFRLEKPDGGTAVGDAFETPNKLGLTLTDYCEALREETLRCHVPMIEMGRQVNIHMANEAVCLEDHVHPNEVGYQRISAVLYQAIREQWALTHEMPQDAFSAMP